MIFNLDNRKAHVREEGRRHPVRCGEALSAAYLRL